MNLLMLFFIILTVFLTGGFFLFDKDRKKIPKYKLLRERAIKIAKEQGINSVSEANKRINLAGTDTKYWGKGKDYEPVTTISIYEAVSLLKKPDAVFLDVRREVEHKNEHIDNSLWIPSEQLDQRISELDSLKDKQIVVYCRLGNISLTSTEILVEKGFNATTLEGGFMAWKKMQKM